MARDKRLVIEAYVDQADEFRWRMVAANGRIVADSAEGYTRHQDVKRAIKRVLVLIQQGVKEEGQAQ